ncbi:MAG: YhjD/YihY/BrkB family envelope integrity protein, partial [Sciscionella sp.]
MVSTNGAEDGVTGAAEGVGEGARDLRVWARIPLRVVRGLWVDRVLGMAAEVAFWQIVSLPPLLLALLGAVGYTGAVTGTDVLGQVRREIVQAAGLVLTPAVVHQIVQPAVSQALAHGHAGTTAIGIVLSLWAGSTAMGDLMGTVTIAFEMRAMRSPIRTRLLAVVFYVAQVLVGSVLL